MATVAAEEFGGVIGRLIARVAAGEEVVFTEQDRPRVRLVLVEDAAPSKKPRVPGRWKGRISLPPDAFAPLTDEELKDWGL